MSKVNLRNLLEASVSSGHAPPAELLEHTFTKQEIKEQMRLYLRCSMTDWEKTTKKVLFEKIASSWAARVSIPGSPGTPG